MFSRLHTARSTYNGIARISVVALLALVLLAGLIPSGALSALHACKMACCAGKPLHAAGACNAILPRAGRREAPLEANADEQSMHLGEMQTASVAVETVVSSAHCQTAKHASIEQPAPHNAILQQASVAVFTTPCDPECAAALTLLQVRRPREAASLSIVVRPRPPTVVSSASNLLKLSFSSTERRRQYPPRAPPSALVNLYA